MKKIIYNILNMGLPILNIGLPFIDEQIANRKIRNKIQELDECGIPDNYDINEIDIEEFNNDYISSVERANRLEDKAKSLLIAWSITVTLIISLPNMINSICETNWIHKVVVVMGIAAVLYMFLAGLMVIQVLTKENIVQTVPLNKRKNKIDIYKATKGNNYQNFIRNNKIFTAYQSLRNSVIFLSIIFLINIFWS